MSRLIESIKLLDGKFHNLFCHEQRMTRSLQYLYGSSGEVHLLSYLQESEFPRKGLFKCRIVYDNISKDVVFTPYERREIRRIKIVEDDQITYEFKFLNREKIDRLFQMRGDCEDVLIVKEGRVTDCSFSNIVFSKNGEWFTPQTPLLNGTMRQKLIDENKIQIREIHKQDIRSFDKCRIINAMLEFDSPEIEVSDIVF